MADEAASDERTPDPAALEAGRLLFARECEFYNGSTKLETLPEAILPEVAFAGRSNVGKSSLVNVLTGRNTLARTSNTPGRTQQLNFFSLADRLTLVDMPGYGYAEAPKTEIARWTRLVDTYLRGRPSLRRVLLLIDARHGVKKTDEPVMKMLDEAAVSYQLVLTKADKLKPAELAARRDDRGGVAQASHRGSSACPRDLVRKGRGRSNPARGAHRPCGAGSARVIGR